MIIFGVLFLVVLVWLTISVANDVINYLAYNKDEDN